jgi:hypothetical protein
MLNRNWPGGLRGLWHFYQYSREDSVEAEVLFRRALVIDARYAQPAAQLAITLCADLANLTASMKLRAHSKT